MSNYKADTVTMVLVAVGDMLSADGVKDQLIMMSPGLLSCHYLLHCLPSLCSIKA